MKNETDDDRMRRLVTGQFKKQLPRKFYSQVSLSDANAVLLDGRPIKTPMKNPLVLPTRALAEAVAAEWMAQESVIDPERMPLTKLANTALDRATAERASVINELVDYAGSDLVCYWADRPPDLVQRQKALWQPVIDDINQALSARFESRQGILHKAQEAQSLAAMRAAIEALNPWQLTGLYLMTTLSGSALLAMQLLLGQSAAETVWAAAHVDEDYQIEQWGEDDEAQHRRANRRREFDGLVRYFQLLTV